MVVDESLFGRKTKTKGRGGALPARAAVISAAELRRIQGSTRIITAAEIQKDKDELEAIHAVKHKAARARKDRMRALAANACLDADAMGLGVRLSFSAAKTLTRLSKCSLQITVFHQKLSEFLKKKKKKKNF